ncbi:TetR/AcrR family transcriptional regulator [Amnibacterium kyonggiense]
MRTPLTTRERILDAARDLLRESGAGGVTTRAVAQAAGVQAPAIYRLFGDKDGLLEALAERAVAEFAETKHAIVEAAEAEGVDALTDLREGWRANIEFGLTNPALFALMTVPGRAQASAAARAALQVLRARVHRVAAAGRLRVAEDRAVDLIRAAGAGTVMAILTDPDGRRDEALADAMYAAVLAQILTDAPSAEGDGAVAGAVALRARAADLSVLSPAEQHLLGDWLDRVIAAAPPAGGAAGADRSDAPAHPPAGLPPLGTSA